MFLKLDFIASNDFSWINWHNRGEEMFQTIALCENRFDTRNSYPKRVGVRWDSHTPLGFMSRYLKQIYNATKLPKYTHSYIPVNIFFQKCWSWSHFKCSSTNMVGIRHQNRAVPHRRPPRSSDKV